jgi:hypothetical protein
MLLALFIPSAQPQSRLLSAINNDQTIVVSDNTPRVISSGAAIDQGAVPRSQIVPRLFLHFTMTAAQRADLAQFLQAVQDRRSPQYHQFLTPEQYADRFGLGSADIEKISRWLENSGFHSLQVARSRSWISFSGTAAQAESAFHTAIHRYSIHGEEHWSNATDPRVPKAMQGLVDSIRGLHNIPLRPNLIHLHPNFTSSLSGSHFLAPYDWATIYDVQPLYTAGLDGTGVSIAILGQSDVNLSDIQAFRSAAGLSVNNPTVVVPPGDQDPGFQSASGDEVESDLDLEWAGAIAKNASILFVTASFVSGNGVEDALAYAIDNNVAPIVSESYVECEPQETISDFNYQTGLLQQAVAQGMTIIASSGDSGAAACDQGLTESAATLGLAVNFPASSPYVTGIGGTEFNEGAGGYWNATTNSVGGSAFSYIPEIVWNDGFQLASGGGVSTLVAKPVWQTGPGVPADGARDVPDISFSASPDHDEYLICESGSCTNGFQNSSNQVHLVGGTSAGAPSFAGLLALVIQRNGAGTRLGNINPNLYSLAQTSPDAFHDITSGNNDQACATGTPNCPTGTTQIGYAAGTGYDLATGLGSLDGYNFAQQWYGDFQLSASPASVTVQTGSSATTTVTVVPQNNFSGNVTFSCSVSSGLIGITCSVPSTPVGPSGSAVVTISASNIARTPPHAPDRPKPFSGPPSRPWPMLLLAGLLLSLLLPAISRSQPAFRIRPLYAGSVASLLVIAFGAVSCGGGGSTSVSYGGGTTTQPTRALTISCTDPATATVGVAYSGGCTASGGTAPYTYTSMSLPSNLSLNATTGAITGTINSYGTDNFYVTVTDSSSPAQTATSAAQTVVASNSPASALTISCILPPATSGAFYNQGSCTASGGTYGYNFTISAGALPQGLSLYNGQLSGSPLTAGTSSFTVQVTDNGPSLGLPQQTATFVVSNFVVLPGPLTVSCTPYEGQTPEVSIAFTENCSGSAGTMPYSFSITSGTLPPGLTLNASTGVISGVPTTAGSYTATLRLLDSGSPAQSVTQSLNFNVVAYVPMACGGIIAPILYSAQLDVFFSSPYCTVYGGTPPYTYSLTGNVPPGFVIYQTYGLVEGTPTQVGTYSFNVVVKDSASPPATIITPVNNFVVGAHGNEIGTVTVTATSGGITNTTTISVYVP